MVRKFNGYLEKGESIKEVTKAIAEETKEVLFGVLNDDLFYDKPPIILPNKEAYDDYIDTCDDETFEGRKPSPKKVRVTVTVEEVK